VSGFFGIVRRDGESIEKRFLEQIAQQLSFRGPDGRSVWVCGNIGGCFTLMVTGPAEQAAAQPVSCCDRYWLWGDLRLDAREELQEQLGDSRDLPKSNPTSEDLLLRAWAKWGPACLERVIGDFSFALWDAQENVLWCARDFVGARPFYYGQADGLFCFSNTVEVLRQVPGMSSELDEIFLGDFLLTGWQADHWRTIHRDIRRLTAGHLLRHCGGNVDVRRFRKLPIEDPLRLQRPEEYLEAYRELLKITVTDRMPERSVALYLSGGLDSTSVCATATQIASARGQKEQLKAFTYSMTNFFDDSEPKLASLCAQHLGMAHQLFQEPCLTPFENRDHDGDLQPEPNDAVFFASDRRFLAMIANHANVVLSGDGGDDVLTGQAWPYLTDLFRAREWRRMAREFGTYLGTHRRIPPLRGGFRAKLLGLVKKEDPWEGYPQWLNEDFAQRCDLKTRWLAQYDRPNDFEHRLHPLGYRVLHQGVWSLVLEVEDAGWNGIRLETRAPLLDLRILRFFLRLPPVPWCMDKELCRRAMRGILPEPILRREKTPLPIHPVEKSIGVEEFVSWICGQTPGGAEEFVNWKKWCETLRDSKGSLTSEILRPASLLRWLKNVESVCQFQ
jgi:asparagine synthase (glutamine-hydrolysing)